MMITDIEKKYKEKTPQCDMRRLEPDNRVPSGLEK
jgi:hypothetical protein